MLNVGPLELLVVLAVALIVVGPERLPELARSVGRALRQFREVQDEVRDMVSSGMDDEMREAASEFRKAAGTAKRATDVKGAVRRAERSIREETTGALRKPRTSTTSARDEPAPVPGDEPGDRRPADPPDGEAARRPSDGEAAIGSAPTDPAVDGRSELVDGRSEPDADGPDEPPRP
jgi:Tat protein translocase TatB subunit